MRDLWQVDVVDLVAALMGLDLDWHPANNVGVLVPGALGAGLFACAP